MQRFSDVLLSTPGYSFSSSEQKTSHRTARAELCNKQYSAESLLDDFERRNTVERDVFVTYICANLSIKAQLAYSFSQPLPAGFGAAGGLLSLQTHRQSHHNAPMASTTTQNNQHRLLRGSVIPVKSSQGKLMSGNKVGQVGCVLTFGAAQT